MKKITGKALSLVLSLALVVSSFSAAFAFAATKTVSGSVDLKEDDAKAIYLVSGGSHKGVNLTDWINTQSGGVTMDTPDHQDVTVGQIIDVAHASGDRLVKWGDQNGSKIDDGDDAWLFLKGSDSGKEVISVLYSGTYPDDDGNDVTVKAKADITVNVAKEGTVSIGRTYDDLTSRDGKAIEGISSLSQKTDKSDTFDTTDVGLYYVLDDPTGTECLATYKPLTAFVDIAGVDHAEGDDAAAAPFTVKVSGSVANKAKFAATTAAGATVITVTAADGVGTGTLTFTATHTSSGTNKNADLPAVSVGDKNTVADDKVTAKATIEKRVLVQLDTTPGVIKDKKTYLETAEGEVDITGYDIKLAGAVADFSIGDKSVVGKITGTLTGKLSVDSANVDEIDIDKGNVDLTDSKVGPVDTDEGTVDIDGGTTGKVEASGLVTVSTGTVGDIKSDAGIDVYANDDEKTTTVGTLKSSADVTVDSMDSTVAIKSYVAGGAGAHLVLDGSSVTLSSIDLDYRDAVVTLNDFQGKLPSPVNAKFATIETGDEAADVAFTGALTVDSLDLTDASAVAFDNTLKVNYISGSGSLKLPIGGLYVVDGVSGSPVLKFSNDFKVDDVAFKADSDAVDVNDFDGFGFTLAKSAGNTTDTFKIASATFAGLEINPSSARIAIGESQTFKVTAYPSGTSLPAGDSVDWNFDGNENNFKVTKNADGTATVEVIAVDSSFASENKATLTAFLVDEYGDEDSDYAEVDCALTALATPDVTFTSDTTSNFSVAPGASYTFKLTSATAPVLTVGTAGVFSVTDMGKSGNDYFVKITAIGKVGDEAGIYVNGTKLLVASIKSGITSDTTTDITVKKGASYTYKITAPSAPTFSVGTANVLTYKLTSQSGNNYFYQITAVGAVGAKAGIYVNGEKINAVTIG